MLKPYMYHSIFNISILYFITLSIGYVFRTYTFERIKHLPFIKLFYSLLLGGLIGVPYFIGSYSFILLSLLLVGFIVFYFANRYIYLTLLFVFIVKYFIGMDSIDFFFFIGILVYIILIFRLINLKMDELKKSKLVFLLVLLILNSEMIILGYTIEQFLFFNGATVINSLLFLELMKLFTSYNDIYKTTKKLATVDTDSNLYNRLHFNNLYHGKNVNSSMAIIDIDLFKNYESLYGYNITNHIVRKLSSLMLKHLHDIGKVYRYNHDRFYVMVTSNDHHKVIRSFKRLKLDVEESEINIDNYTIRFTISVGIKFNENLLSLDDLIHETNHALRESKILGRNKITVV